MTGLEKASAFASVITAFAAIPTVGILLWYTIETYKLRKQAQLQNWRAIMPIVTIEAARDLPVSEGANMPAVQVVLRNLGPGSAFNIDIDALSGMNSQIHFEHTTALAAGHRQPVWMDVRESSQQAVTGAYENILRMFHTHQLASGYSGVIRYSDVNGKHYQTILTFFYDELAKAVTTKFERIEAPADGKV